ncbi:hypothetical protein MSAN_02466000 [Mycena sanguinolenta]|uniref:Uncharacterized protein n=1 Tax=Mycena sanguinolenta TaxID=230812 RepID=A0A8H7CAF6_9AGAR|nr:hypothetical protein MSAN_02466000 [Mycena sanguinolenta]
MAAPVPYDSDTSTVKTRGPVTWDIRGVQNNWNWRVEREGGSVDDAVEYQTRFPEKNVAHVYRGVDDSAPLLATIRTRNYSWTAIITFSEALVPQREPVTMDNVGSGFYTKWPVKVRALGDRELFWEYEHPVQGDNNILLLDTATGEELGNSNDNYLALTTELPEDAVEELVIMGTAVMKMLSSLMHNDMCIAAEGPDGAQRWKYQEPNWWDNEENFEDAEEDENEALMLQNMDPE